MGSPGCSLKGLCVVEILRIQCVCPGVYEYVCHGVCAHPGVCHGVCARALWCVYVCVPWCVCVMLCVCLAFECTSKECWAETDSLGSWLHGGLEISAHVT